MRRFKNFNFVHVTSKWTLHHVLRALWMHSNDTSKSSYKMCDFMVLRERIFVLYDAFEKWIYRMKYECESDEHNPCWIGPHKWNAFGVRMYALNVGIQFSKHSCCQFNAFNACEHAPMLFKWWNNFLHHFNCIDKTLSLKSTLS